MYGGEPNWGQLAKALAPLLQEHDPAEVLRYWRHYLSRTPAKFASANRFAITYGAWNPSTPDPEAWKYDRFAFRPGETQEAYIRRTSEGPSR